MTGPLRRAIEAASYRASRTATRVGVGAKRAAFDHKPPGTPTPRVQVWSRDKVRLYRYLPVEGVERGGPPVLFVMSLVTTSLVFDLQEGNSLVRRFLDAGRDVFLLDWGVPDAVEAANTLETYCDDYIPHAVRATLEESGEEELVLYGYCLGAVLSMLSLAGHPTMPVRAMMLLATPVDMSELGPLTSMLRAGQLETKDLIDWTGNVPAARIKQSFYLVEPAGEVTTYVSLWTSLADPERLAAHDALVRWSSGHIPFPGAAFAQIDTLFIRDDALVRGRVPMGRRVVDLGDITVPTLSITGAKDKLVPPTCSEPLSLPGAPLDHLVLPAGHAGMIVGRKAHRDLIPSMLEWLDEHA